MASQTLAENWLKTLWEPEETPLLSYRPFRQRLEPAQENEQLDAEGASGTVSAASKDFLAHVIPRRVESTPVESSFKPIPDFCTQGEDSPPADQTHLIAKQRVRLLAREYVHGPTPESDARIEILTERLNKVLPPVAEEQWMALESIADDLEEVKARRQEIRQRFDLK